MFQDTRPSKDDGMFNTGKITDPITRGLWPMHQMIADYFVGHLMIAGVKVASQ